MRRWFLALFAVLTLGAGLALTPGGTAFAAANPRPPTKWNGPTPGGRLVYSATFTGGSMKGWAPTNQFGNRTATVSDDSDGLDITTTATNQLAEVESPSRVTWSPGDTVRAEIYLPYTSTIQSGYSGNIGNFPSLWSWADLGRTRANDEEIDVFEGLNSPAHPGDNGGATCSHTHYWIGNNYQNDQTGICATSTDSWGGWVTYTAEWVKGNQPSDDSVKFWYNHTYIGDEPMPGTSSMRFFLQDSTISTSTPCPECYGPTITPSTVSMARINIYQNRRHPT